MMRFYKELDSKERRFFRSGFKFILIVGLLSIIVLPILLTSTKISFINFNDTGQIGETINGISAPFIALLAAILTFLAFFIQYKANKIQIDQINEQKKQFDKQYNEQKEQFQIQNENQIFYRLLESHENRVANAYTIDQRIEVKGFLYLKLISETALDFIREEAISFARNLLRDKPELIDDLYYIKMYQANHIKIYQDAKRKFLNQITPLGSGDRWEFIKEYFNSVGNESKEQKDVLRAIGSVYFYKVSFEDRYEMYRITFQKIENKFGDFLDGYLKNWEFFCTYTSNTKNQKDYIQHLSNQLSKYETVILFYYIASDNCSPILKEFFKSHNLMANLHKYNGELIDAPSKEQLHEELNFILN